MCGRCESKRANGRANGPCSTAPSIDLIHFLPTVLCLPAALPRAALPWLGTPRDKHTQAQLIRIFRLQRLGPEIFFYFLSLSLSGLSCFPPSFILSDFRCVFLFLTIYSLVLFLSIVLQCIIDFNGSNKPLNYRPFSTWTSLYVLLSIPRNSRNVYMRNSSFFFLPLGG